MVNVPIDDEDLPAISTELDLSISRGHSDVVEQTKATGGVTFGVMSRRPNDRQSVASPFIYDIVDDVEQTTATQSRAVVRRVVEIDGIKRRL